jgi:hypothetical protein
LILKKHFNQKKKKTNNKTKFFNEQIIKKYKLLNNKI